MQGSSFFGEKTGKGGLTAVNGTEEDAQNTAAERTEN